MRLCARRLDCGRGRRRVEAARGRDDGIADVSRPTLAVGVSAGARAVGVALSRAEPVNGCEPVAEVMDAGALEAHRRAYLEIDDDPGAARAAFAELAGRSPDDPLIGFHHRRLEAGARTALIGG